MCSLKEIKFLREATKESRLFVHQSGPVLQLSPKSSFMLDVKTENCGELGVEKSTEILQKDPVSQLVLPIC